MTPTDLLNDIASLVSEAVRARLSSWKRGDLAANIILERPAGKGHGDLSTNLAMIAAGAAGMPPRKAAELLIEDLRASGDLMKLCREIEIAGPGFINLFLEDRALAETAGRALADGMEFGAGVADKPESILLEYVSANPTGPLHAGHARYAAFGDSLKRILAYAGHEVTTEFYINDYGTQMLNFGKSLAVRYAQQFGHEVSFPEEGYQGEYTVRIASLIKQQIGDEMIGHVLPEPDQEAIDFFKKEGCGLVLDDIRAILARFRVEFDVWFSESALYQSGAVDESLKTLEAAGEIEIRDGAKWLLTSRFGDDKDRVLIRSSGEPTYFTSDIAYHRQKLSRGFDRLINIWGADHHGYVPRMKAAFEALSHDPQRFEIIIGQLVNVIEMGERKQMSKRAGTMVTLQELLDSIGTDAARFFLVERSNDSTLDLDLEKAKLQSEENPVYYVQYAHARICSILRRAAEQGVAEPADNTDRLAGPLAGQERELILKLAAFPRTVLSAAEIRGPHRITTYARELAAIFHVFYHNCPVIRAEAATAAFRLDLCRLTRNVIARSLDLVGVEAPESM
ncbi:MAG: arginine--tRNA ligase [Actinobacteria bacterium]|nr:arginine--tRNA ligase [Actinomycetota bacterium]MCL5883379.1 arginine--tRNA ligase [Actinomycetota bacterium]